MSETIRDVVIRVSLESDSKKFKIPELKGAEDGVKQISVRADSARKSVAQVAEESSKAVAEMRQLSSEAQSAGKTANDAFSTAAGGVLNFGRGIALASVSGEKDLAKMAEAIVGIEAGVSVFVGVKDAIFGVVEGAQAMASASKAAAAANSVVATSNTAVATTGTAASGAMIGLQASLGPIVLAAAALSAGVYLLVRAWSENEKKVKANQERLKQYGRTMVEVARESRIAKADIAIGGLGRVAGTLEGAGLLGESLTVREEQKKAAAQAVARQKKTLGSDQSSIQAAARDAEGATEKVRKLRSEIGSLQDTIRKIDSTSQDGFGGLGASSQDESRLSVKQQELTKALADQARFQERLKDTRLQAAKSAEQLLKFTDQQIEAEESVRATARAIVEERRKAIQLRRDEIKSAKELYEAERNRQKDEATRVGELLADPRRLQQFQQQSKKVQAAGASASARDLVRLRELGGGLADSFANSRLSDLGTAALRKSDFLKSTRERFAVERDESGRVSTRGTGRFGAGVGDTFAGIRAVVGAEKDLNEGLSEAVRELGTLKETEAKSTRELVEIVKGLVRDRQVTAAEVEQIKSGLKLAQGARRQG